MARQSWIQGPDGVLYEKDKYPSFDKNNCPVVIPDIQPYRSMITGEEITSRSKHREHLKEHGCFEVGNDSSLWKSRKPLPDVDPQGRKELIKHQVSKLTDSEFRKMVHRDVQEARWNSRKD